MRKGPDTATKKAIDARRSKWARMTPQERAHVIQDRIARFLSWVELTRETEGAEDAPYTERDLTSV